MKSAPEGKHLFVKLDASLLSNQREFAKKVIAQYPSVNYLVVTHGIATTQGRTPTTEGIDVKMALHYYSRMQLITSLAPALSDGARVMSVLSGGVHKPYVHDDLALVTNYSLVNAANAAGFYNDLGLAKLSQLYPKVSFIHAAPGVRVLSSIMMMISLSVQIGAQRCHVCICICMLIIIVLGYIKGPVRAMQVFGRSLDNCGDYMCYGLFAPKFADGFHCLSPDGDEAKVTAEHTDANIERIWQHTLEVFKSTEKPVVESSS